MRTRCDAFAARARAAHADDARHARVTVEDASMDMSDASTRPGDASAGARDVLDARETLEDGPKRLMKIIRAPVTRASAHWRSFAQVQFACPSSAGEATSRVRKNLSSFGYCYVVVALGASVLFAASRLFSVVVLFAAFMVHHYVARVHRAPVEVGGRVLSVRTQSLALAATTAFFCWSFIVDVVFRAVVFGVIFALAHALMRIPEPKTDEGNGEIPVLRDFAAAYRDSGVAELVPAQVTSTVRGLFASRK